MKTNHLFSIVILAFCACLMAGCSSTKSMRAEDGLLLRYQLPVKHVLNYAFRNSSLQKMEVMGRTMEVTMESDLMFSMSSQGFEGERNDVKVTIDSMSFRLKSPQGALSPDMKNVMGKSFAMKLSVLGKESDITGTEGIEYELAPGQKQNATNGFAAIFPDLAGRTVKRGDTWTSTDTLLQKTSSGFIRIVFNYTSTLAGLETIGERPCAKIISTFSGPMHSEEAQGPMTFVTNGTMKGVDTVYFAYKDGVLLSVKTMAALDALAEGTGPQNMSIPLKREMTNEVRLTSALPPAAE